MRLLIISLCIILAYATIVFAGDIEDTAMQTVMTGSVIKHGNGYVLEGIYNGRNARGCHLVSVQKRWTISGFVDIYNFVICNSVITTAKESPLEMPDVPKELIFKAAKSAQRYGISSAGYFDYRIKANALRDRDMCLVEIKVLKGIALMQRKIVDACKGKIINKLN
jgi:hypothetical protein